MCTYFILYLIKFTCLPLLLCILWCLVCFHLLANHEFCFLNWISYLRETQLKSWTQKISFYQWRCSELLLWVGMKCISRLPSLFWQEVCSEYRQFVRNGKLPCTRENDPVQGPDGKMHGNTCSMCEAFLWVELLLGKWGRVLSFLLHVSLFGSFILFLKLCLFLVNGICMCVCVAHFSTML